MTLATGWKLAQREENPIILVWPFLKISFTEFSLSRAVLWRFPSSPSPFSPLATGPYVMCDFADPVIADGLRNRQIWPSGPSLSPEHQCLRKTHACIPINAPGLHFLQRIRTYPANRQPAKHPHLPSPKISFSCWARILNPIREKKMFLDSWLVDFKNLI